MTLKIQLPVIASLLLLLSVSAAAQAPAQYSKLPCGLYQSTDGTLAYQSQQVMDEEGSRKLVYTDQFYSTGKITHLKDVIDTASFTFLNYCFWKDKNHIYIFTPTSSGGNLSVADFGDPATFTSMGQDTRYAKDKDHAYYFYDVMEGADAATLTLINTNDQGADLAYDKNYFYANGKRLTRAEIKEYQLERLQNKK